MSQYYTAIGEPKEFDRNFFLRIIRETFITRKFPIKFIKKIQNPDEYLTATDWFECNHVNVRYLTIFNENYHVIHFKVSYKRDDIVYGELFIQDAIASIMFILYDLNITVLINKLLYTTSPYNYMETKKYKIYINLDTKAEFKDEDYITNKTIQFLILSKQEFTF